MAYVATGYWIAGYAVGDGAAPPVQVGGGKGRGKRKKYVIEGKTLTLTKEELDDVLETMLREVPEKEPDAPKPTKREKPKDAAVIEAFPAYPDIRDLLLAAGQVEAAQRLLAVAKRLAEEQDEEDVEILLMYG